MGIRILVASACLTVAGNAQAQTEPEPITAVVRGQRPARSASEVTRDRAVLQAAPHRSADELLSVVPGIFITQHSGEGKAYQIFYRGFDAVHGQDVEIWAGGAPVNDVSNLHGQGYADLHFLPVETVREIAASPGTYDPRQGDFAVAGTLRLELGYDQPGLTTKVQTGSFGTRRLFLAFRPTGHPEGTFAAAEIYRTNGFGPSRAADRVSTVAQVIHRVGPNATLRVLATAYAGTFASAGVLRLSDVESGAVDRFAGYDTTQGGAASRGQVVVEWGREDPDQSMSLTGYLIQRTMRLRHNFTGYLIDPSGDSEQQRNNAGTAGFTGLYRKNVGWLRSDDSIEMGVFARMDMIEQSQDRLAVADSRVTASQVRAQIGARDLGGYLDLALHPHGRVVLRGGVRVDGLAYESRDLYERGRQARSSQGVHVGKKGTLDVRITRWLHGLASYGEGFRSPQARSLTQGETAPFSQVRSVEMGLRAGTKGVRATVAAFRTDLSDDLIFDHVSTRNERVPATRRTGITADLTLFPFRWLNGAISTTYTRATFRGSDPVRQAGDLVPYAPQWVARGDLVAQQKIGAIKGQAVQGHLGLGSSVLARRPLPYGQWGHDVWLLDAAAGVRVGAVEIGLELTNATGARWFDGEFVFPSQWSPSAGASLVPERHVTAGAPRMLMLSLAAFL